MSNSPVPTVISATAPQRQGGNGVERAAVNSVQYLTPPRPNRPGVGASSGHYQRERGGGNSGAGAGERRQKSSSSGRAMSAPSHAAAINSIDDDLLYSLTDTPQKGRRGEVNVTHLLSFSLKEREKVPPLPRKVHHSHSYQSTQYQKERFLQANYRFLVSEGGDYSIHMAVADHMFDWDSLLQVIVTSTAHYDCPVCLYSPVAAKITRCGHIFCWTCLLRLFAQNDKSWGHCPTCKEFVSHRDLKPAVFDPRRQIKEGNKVQMQLFKREKGTVIPLLHDSVVFSSNRYPRFGEANANFAKFCVLSKGQHESNVLQRELLELQTALQEAKSSQENEIVPFLEAAISSVESEICEYNENSSSLFPEEVSRVSSSPAVLMRKGHNVSNSALSASNSTFSASNSAIPAATYSSPFIPPSDAELQLGFESLVQRTASGMKITASEFVPSYISQASTPTITQKTSQESGPKSSQKVGQKVSQEYDDEGLFYFYQAKDGQNIFLHPLNFRILLTNSGNSPNQLPPFIESKVLEIENYSQSEILRKKFRSLSHLPLSCDFALAELDLSQIISAPILSQFGEELHKRDMRRKQRAKQARNDAIRSQRRQESMPLMPSDAEFAYSARETYVPDFEISAAAAATASDPSGVSFAQVVNDGYAALGPSIAAKKAQNSTQNSTLNPWGKAVSSNTGVNAGSTGVNAGSTGVNTRNTGVDGDELIAPTLQSGWAAGWNEATASISSSKDKKKKKKGRGTLLISNSFNVHI